MSVRLPVAVLGFGLGVLLVLQAAFVACAVLFLRPAPTKLPLERSAEQAANREPRP